VPKERASLVRLGVVVLLALTACESSVAPTTKAPLTFFLDCVSGDDEAAGTTERTAWRSLDRLWNATLAPGDRLLLARDCSWIGPLTIRWSGTAAAPIVVGAYGDGERPAIRDSRDNHIVITGSHVVVEGLRSFTSPGTFATESGCQDQPVGWRTGFTVADGAGHVTIRGSQAYGNTIGVRISHGAHHVHVVDNELFANVALAKNTPGGDDDYGAWGVLIEGTDNVVGHNRFWGNAAWCSYDYGQDGAAIEIYAGVRNLIHHNVSRDDAAFVEIGSSEERISSDNVVAFNTYVSDRPAAEFLMVHAGQKFGPTLRTQALHNTVYLPRPERTQGATCYGATCGPEVLSLHNNILVVGWRAIYAEGSIGESHNVVWRPVGDPALAVQGGAQLSPTSFLADPRLADADRGDLRLRAGSPAIGAGADLALAFATDAGGDPLGRPFDIGAFAYREVLAGAAD
jgi:hypothetical protein